MTYQELYAFGEQTLAAAFDADAKTDAWLLLSYVCKMERSSYYLHMQDKVADEKVETYRELLERRLQHVPLQYILGETEFMGLPFVVNQDVLIPRADTEILVEEALNYLQPGMDILDMCTGSGCILISLLKNRQNCTGIGADISSKALAVAKTNASRNEVNASFLESDLFETVSGTFDVIVSNPPYIPTQIVSKLMPEVRDFEPVWALDGREDGLYFYRRIISECRQYLKPEGVILFEIGYDQGEDVAALLREAGFSQVEVKQDLAHLDRVVIGK